MDVDTLTSMISSFQTFGSQNCPKELTLEMVLGQGGEQGTVNVQITGQYLGSEDDYCNAIRPFLASLPKEQSKDVESLGWLQGLQKLGGVSTLNTTGVSDTVS